MRATMKSTPAFCKVDIATAPKHVKDMLREVYQTLQQAESDFDRMQFNTVVSAA